ncbi:hypothetical protein K438DRAFT_2016446 [Mycena galopus ATCC 62051]|nr:hypothetical protein K438DRAFT_2016446 [Mycena galopus ATCC 62051]
MAKKTRNQRRRAREYSPVLDATTHDSPVPAIVIDQDDGDPLSSGSIAATSVTPPVAAVGARSAGSSADRFPSLASPQSPAPERLRPASWTRSEVSTPPQTSNSRLSAPNTLGSTSATPLLSPAKISESGRKNAQKQKRGRSRESDTRRSIDSSRRHATIEEVDDVDDTPAINAARAENLKKRREKEGSRDKSVSKISHPSSRSHRSRTSPERETSSRQVEKPSRSTQKSRSRTDHGRESSRSRKSGSLHTQSGSQAPYPAASILEEYTESMGSTARARRRREKRPASPVSTARNLPLPSSKDPISSDDDVDILSINNSVAYRLNEEAIARHRAHADDSSEARARIEKSRAQLRGLQDQRVEEDGNFAVNLAIQYATEDADREVARKISQ